MHTLYGKSYIFFNSSEGYDMIRLYKIIISVHMF